MNFLDKLKPGDKVIVESMTSYSNIFPIVGKVVRCTKNLVIVEINGHETRFNKSTRREYGMSVFGSCYLRQATSKRIAKVEQYNRRKELRKLIEAFVSRGKLHQMTDETLEAVAKLLGIEDDKGVKK